MLLEHCVIGTCKKLEQIIRSIDSIFGIIWQVPSTSPLYTYVICLYFFRSIYKPIVLNISIHAYLCTLCVQKLCECGHWLPFYLGVSFFLKRIVFYLIEWITCQLGSLNARLQVIWTSTSCGVGAQKWSSYCRLLLLSLGPRAPDETRKDRLVIHISGASHCESVDLMIGWEDLWLWRSL